ncbi:MAG: hypothetical protein HW408_1727 [Actinobacteria bacterium]|nr:hypothetical protein [Actinomycetota bacterium]
MLAKRSWKSERISRYSGRSRTVRSRCSRFLPVCGILCRLAFYLPDISLYHFGWCFFAQIRRTLP